MSAPKGSVGELVGWLNTLDQDARVSILIDDIDLSRVKRNDGGIYKLGVVLDDSDGEVFFYVGRLRPRSDFDPGCNDCGMDSHPDHPGGCPSQQEVRT